MSCRSWFLTLAAAASAAAAGAGRSWRRRSRRTTQVSEIIVYGTDPCPRSTDDEVGGLRPQAGRASAIAFPKRYVRADRCSRAEAWANQRHQLSRPYGRTGINSCSPVGPGGLTGCASR